MTVGHVYHDESEGDPWHVGTRAEELGNAVCSGGTDEEARSSPPEVEKANEIEGRGP